MLRLRALFRKERVEQELDEELRFHLEKQIEQNRAAGMSAEEACYAALRQFGSVEAVKEECRQNRATYFLETLFQDLRFGLRQLRRSPGFTVVAVVTLALGIGANTAIFSVVDAVLLRSIPYAHSNRLIMVWTTFASLANAQGGSAPPDFREWQRQNRVFEGMAAFWLNDMNLSMAGEEPQRLQGAFISHNLFPLLGIKPALGRNFLPEEEQFGKNHVALISDILSRQRWGGERNNVGRTINLEGTSFTVVGVMPKGMPFFDDVPPVDIFVPFSFAPKDFMNTRSNHFLPVVALLKPGVTLQQAQTDMSTIAARIARQYPENAGLGAKVVSLREQMVGDFRPALLVLLAAVGFVLLMACANVAHLLLARAVAREKEIAVRMALGAGRARLVKQLLLESVLLALIGGSAGVALAQWGMASLRSLIPANLPRFNDIRVDGRVLFFTVLVSLSTALIFGLIPALQSAKADLHNALKQGGRGATEAGGRHRIRTSLVVCELASAVLLLIGAGLMVKSFARLRRVDPGFSPEGVLALQIPLSAKKYPQPAQGRAFLQQLLERVRVLPGVSAVGVSTELPLGFGNGWRKYFTVIGQPEPTSLEKVPNVRFELNSPDYFSTIRARLLAGRLFSSLDDERAQPVAIINEALRRRFFPNEDPIGKPVRMLPPLSLLVKFASASDLTPSQLAPERVVIGVIDDIRNTTLNRPAEPTVYVPWTQDKNEGWFNTLYLAVRQRSRPVDLAPMVRAEVRALDLDQPIGEVATLNELVGRSASRTRFTTLLLALFAGVGLVIALVGVYGVMAYSVERRAHEIGIRMALGATPRDVVRMIIGQALLLSAMGLAGGVAAALALTRFLTSELYGVKPADPATFLAVSFVLTAVALAASYIPARPATKVDPMVALRYE